METVLSMIAIVISVLSIAVALYTFFWTAYRDKKQATLDAYNRLQEQALDALNDFSFKSVQEIAKHNQSEEYKKISQYIARVEHFCVGVNKNIYDRQTVYELAHGYLDDRIKKRIEPIIERKNHSGKEDYYANIHRLCRWMEKEAKKREKRRIQKFQKKCIEFVSKNGEVS